MDIDILQKYYIISDGKIIVVDDYNYHNYGGYQYTINGVKRLASHITLDYKIVTVYINDDRDTITDKLIWKVKNRFLKNQTDIDYTEETKYIKFTDLPDNQLSLITNVLLSEKYRGYLFKHKELLYGIFNNYGRYRKIIKIKNKIKDAKKANTAILLD